MTGPDTFYICNRKKACCISESCGTLCRHTSDEEFAKNAPEDRIFETIPFYKLDPENLGSGYLIEHVWGVEKNDK